MATLLTSLLDRTTLTEKGRFARAVADEKAQLDRAAQAGRIGEPPAPLPHDKETDSAVWKIHVPNQPPRSMRLGHVPADSGQHVVLVDADRFYRAWLNRPMPVNDLHGTDGCPLRADMPKDRKYASAVEGFDLEARTAVPLANVHCQRAENGEPRIMFTNGITRTYWLLANQAESFPVLVSNATEAQALHEAAGVGPGPQRAADVHAQSRQQAEQQATVKPEPRDPSARPLLDRGPRSRGSRGL
jgi:hypothetical protein